MKYLKKLLIKDYSKVSTLINSILFFILGSIIITNPTITVKFISYALGGYFTILGFLNIFNYLKQRKNDENNIFVLIFGIISLLLGLILILFIFPIEHLIRLVIGAWILFNGINMIIYTLKLRKEKAFKLFLLLSLLIIANGITLILIKNLTFNLIGLFLIINSTLEITGYVYYSQVGNEKNT